MIVVANRDHFGDHRLRTDVDPLASSDDAVRRDERMRFDLDRGIYGSRHNPGVRSYLRAVTDRGSSNDPHAAPEPHFTTHMNSPSHSVSRRPQPGACCFEATEKRHLQFQPRLAQWYGSRLEVWFASTSHGAPLTSIQASSFGRSEAQKAWERLLSLSAEWDATARRFAVGIQFSDLSGSDRSHA
jgi:hypothetical protein